MIRFGIALVSALLVAGCGDGDATVGDGATARDHIAGVSILDELPPYMPAPRVPADNQLTPARVDLGRHLFYDRRLSANATQSCATCHQQERAFTDGLRQSVGSTGEPHPRNAPSLANAVYYQTLNWADPDLRSLEVQHFGPLLASAPVEMGIRADNEAEVLARFRQDPAYRQMFAAAYPDADIELGTIVRAIASFSRTILSYRSAYDRYLQGDEEALSASSQRGLALFESAELRCAQCHGGFNLSDNTRYSDEGIAPFHNTGLYNIVDPASGESDNYPEHNQGLYEHSGRAGDKGHMKAPSLRNIALTAPYNHDGSVASLEDVIDNYARGGRLVIQPARHVGDGRFNRNRDGKIRGFSLSAEDKADLLAFLHSLTDHAMTGDPRLANPHAEQ